MKRSPPHMICRTRITTNRQESREGIRGRGLHRMGSEVHSRCSLCEHSGRGARWHGGCERPRGAFRRVAAAAGRAGSRHWTAGAEHWLLNKLRSSHRRNRGAVGQWSSIRPYISKISARRHRPRCDMIDQGCDARRVTTVSRNVKGGSALAARHVKHASWDRQQSTKRRFASVETRGVD